VYQHSHGSLPARQRVYRRERSSHSFSDAYTVHMSGRRLEPISPRAPVSVKVPAARMRGPHGCDERRVLLHPIHTVAARGEPQVSRVLIRFLGHFCSRV